MIKKVVPVYWHRSVNFGDKASQYIVEKLSNCDVVYCDFLNKCERLMVTGSILQDPNLSTSVIWGNGFVSYNDTVYKPLSISAVRGKLTRSKFIDNRIDCPEVYGDPALLFPIIYNPTITKKYKIGIAPHIIDYEQAVSMYSNRPDIKIIDLKGEVENVINEFLECEHIYSSSLHGVITAHAYKISASWIKFSDKIIGDGFKFHDYFSSVFDFNNYQREAHSVYSNHHSLFDAPVIPHGKDITSNLLNSYPLEKK